MRIYIIGLLFAVMVGIFYVLPDLLFQNSKDYKGLTILATDAEVMYLSRINGVYKGCTFNCNPYIKEYSYNFPYYNSTLSETILALPGIITGLDTIDLKVIYNFLLPALLFFLIYLLIFRLTKNIWLSNLGALFILLGSNLLNSNSIVNISDIVDLFKLKASSSQFLTYSRPVHPQFSTLFFITYLHVLLSALSEKTKKWYILLSITYGFSFYVYFFVYAFISVVQVVTISVYFIYKKFDIARPIIFSTVIGLILAIPVFSQVLNLLNHKYYNTIPFDYLVNTHMPSISYLGVLLFSIFATLIYLYWKKYKSFTNESIFVFIIALACFVTRNEHVVTGKIMQYDHFEMHVFAPVFVIVLCFIVSFLADFNNKKNTYKYILISLCIIPIFNASLIQINSYKIWSPYYTNLQREIYVLKWLNKKIPEKSIISASDPMAGLIIIFTKDYVIWSAYANQWISLPDRQYDILHSRESLKNLEIMAKKYKVDYFLENKKDDLLKHSNKKKIYDDGLYVVYEN